MAYRIEGQERSLADFNYQLMSKGFTFVEVMISVGITSILVLAIMGLMQVTDTYWNQDSGLVDLQQEVRRGVERMSKEIRQASQNAINVTVNNTQLDFSIPLDITTSPTTYSANIIYYLNSVSGQILRSSAGIAPSVVASNITTLNFCCDNGAGSCTSTCTNAKLLKIDLRASKTVREQQLFFPINGNYTERVVLRNN